ncbi:hypothetical protein [Filimonas effusa]|uniref:Outer membrane protein beta-barrel domain-containing protein n=1 Tax=Filimonas effusa TaxID=2508721 RepID=A0A4Q1D673_9BACT|nr:hypothetical protein [Filimonas effusa]RXK83466.1 hypothetical protein ESB13_15340 [Filimonas effusa]
MLKKTLIFSLLTLAGWQAWAQDPITRDKGFYLKAAGGYFFSVSPGQFPNVGPYEPKEIYQTVNPATGAYTVTSQKILTGSYGAGARGGLTFGYQFTRYVSAELAVNYYHSKKNLMTYQNTTIQNTTTKAGEVRSHGHVNALDVAPSLVMSPGLSGRLNPYIRIGVVVPVWGRLIIETEGYRLSSVPGQPALSAQTNIQREEKVKPNATIGFQGALGVTLKAGNRLSFFLETEYRNVPVVGKSKEVTAYNETTNVINNTNGSVVSSSSRGINDLSTAERNTTYHTTINQNSNTPTGTTDPAHPTQTQYKDNNRPADDLRSYINIGGLGLNLGIRLNI